MNVLIVDDEYSGRNTLLILLKNHCARFLNTIEAVANLEEAKKMISSKSIDVLFLDIRLNCASGFDLISFIPESTKIIFVTAYSDYALTAIKNRAFDFFLKPIKADELVSCIERCYQNFQQKVKQFLTIKNNGMNIPLKYNDIYLIKARGPYSDIHDISGKIIVTSQTLKVLETKLNDSFMRIHKSFIVNNIYIKGFNQKEVLVNDLSIPLSRYGHLLLLDYFSS